MYSMVEPVLHRIAPVSPHFVPNVEMGYVRNVHLVSMLMAMEYARRGLAYYAILHPDHIIPTAKQIYMVVHPMLEYRPIYSKIHSYQSAYPYTLAKTNNISINKILGQLAQYCRHQLAQLHTPNLSHLLH